MPQHTADRRCGSSSRRYFACKSSTSLASNVRQIHLRLHSGDTRQESDLKNRFQNTWSTCSKLYPGTYLVIFLSSFLPYHWSEFPQTFQSDYCYYSGLSLHFQRPQEGDLLRLEWKKNRIMVTLPHTGQAVLKGLSYCVTFYNSLINILTTSICCSEVSAGWG